MEDKINEHTLEKYNRTLITMAKRGNTVLAMHATVINKEDKEAMLLYSCCRLDTGRHTTFLWLVSPCLPPNRTYMSPCIRLSIGKHSIVRFL